MTENTLERYSYSFLLNRALSRVPDTIDKREGSIIFDALAPFCYELAEAYLELKRISDESFADTASGEYLDRLCLESGVFRKAASHATFAARLVPVTQENVSVPEGTRFTSVSGKEPLNFTVLSKMQEDGDKYLLQCETAGTSANGYLGAIVPLSHITALAYAEITALLTPGSEREDDEALRKRFLNLLQEHPYGGNLVQYREELLSFDGVGAAQIYPVWEGGGSVKCVLLNTNFRAAGESLVNQVQQAVDPGGGTGEGFAPIGHRVTISAPEEKVLNISCLVTLKAGYSAGQLEASVQSAVEGYFLSLRKAWAEGNGTYATGVFLSRINAAILDVPGIENVTNTMINGVAQDIHLAQTAQKQEIPILGGVIIGEI